MYVKTILSLLILFLGLSTLTHAKYTANNGYLISDTPVTVNYIICSEVLPKKCNSNEIETKQKILDVVPKTNVIENIPEKGVARILSLSTGHYSNVYRYPVRSPCLLYPNQAVKFEVYDDIVVCRSERPTVAVAQ